MRPFNVALSQTATSVATIFTNYVYSLPKYLLTFSILLQKKGSSTILLFFSRFFLSLLLNRQTIRFSFIYNIYIFIRRFVLELGQFRATKLNTWSRLGGSCSKFQRHLCSLCLAFSHGRDLLRSLFDAQKRQLFVHAILVVETAN